MRSALNALLFRTGDQSRDFSLVIATNRPGDLDAAVLDRMDESLEFALPGLAERQQIIALYMDQYLVQAGTAEGGAGSGSHRGLGERLRVRVYHMGGSTVRNGKSGDAKGASQGGSLWGDALHRTMQCQRGRFRGCGEVLLRLQAAFHGASMAGCLSG